uniref:Uncharacterized protein n=1 Tax=Arundo donax TaxID=35708 RepID=A0A0A9GGE6_ARUDO
MFLEEDYALCRRKMAHMNKKKFLPGKEEISRRVVAQ